MRIERQVTTVILLWLIALGAWAQTTVRASVSGKAQIHGPTITNLSREAGSAAGGASVVVTGTGFQATPSVYFGGTASGTVTFQSATQITATTPAHAAGVVDVTVVNPDGTRATITHGFNALAAGPPEYTDYGPAFEYFPAPTTTYTSNGFETDLGNFASDANCSAVVTSTDFAHGGTKSAKTECVSANGASRLDYRFCNASAPWSSGAYPCNPGLSETNGFFQRFYLLMPEADIDAVSANGQLKLLLNRSNVGSPPLDGRWWALVFGPEVGSPTDGLRCIEDSDQDVITTWCNQFFNGTGGTWHEFQTWFKRDSGQSKGRAKLWINGRLIRDSGYLPWMGSNNSGYEQAVWIGLVVGQNIASGPIRVYVDDVALANGFIDP